MNKPTVRAWLMSTRSLSGTCAERLAKLSAIVSGACGVPTSLEAGYANSDYGISLLYGMAGSTKLASIAGAIEELTAVASTIAAAVEQQGMTTRDIAGSMQTAAGGTARASDEIHSIEEAASRSATSVGEIAAWVERLSSRADDLETKVKSFFAQVRAA